MGVNISRHIPERKLHLVIPSVKKKSDIIPNLRMFHGIDSFIEKAPITASKSVSNLAGYISQKATTDLEKVRAVYQWVIKNISYDEFGRVPDYKMSHEAESVLRCRKAVCLGYATLFAELCSQCGIVAEVITGCTRGDGWKTDGYAQPSLTKDGGHAWNAVYINDEWRLIDCTWDSGHIGEDGIFTRHEGEFYFLTDPEIFINDHYPYHENYTEKGKHWQLLREPLDYNTFQNGLRVSRHAYDFHIQPLSHKTFIVQVDKEVEILLRDVDNSLDNIFTSFVSDKEKYERFIFAYKKGDRLYSIVLRPPIQKTYKLKIYGTLKDLEESSQLPYYLFTYRIECVAAHGNLNPFPKHQGIWGIVKTYENYGFENGFPKQPSFKTMNGELSIALPVAKRNFVDCIAELSHVDQETRDDDFVHVERSKHNIHLDIRLGRKGFHKLRVFAIKDGNTEQAYDLIANYLVDCDTPIERCDSFPKSYQAALRYQVSLKQPLNRVLPANTEVKIVLSSPLLSCVLVKKKVAIKRNNTLFQLTTPKMNPGDTLVVHGAAESTGELEVLYKFEVK